MYNEETSKDLAERIISEDGTKQIIPTDWSELDQVREQAMNPNNFSPISPFGRSGRVYSAFQALREKGMIQDAYNVEGVTDDEIGAYREKAAMDVKRDRDDLVIAAAEAAVKLNVAPGTLTQFLLTPPTVMEEATGLEKKSIETPTEEALETNTDLKMAQVDSAMKMQDDITDLFIKSRIAQQYIDKSTEDVKNMNVVSTAMSMLARWLPGAETIKANVTDPLNVGWSFLTINERKKQKEAIKQVMLNSTEDEWKIFLEGLHQTLNELTNDPVAVNDFWKETFGTPSVQSVINLGVDAAIGLKMFAAPKLVDKIIARNAKDISTAEKIGDTKKVLEEVSKNLTGATALEVGADIKTLKKITDTAVDMQKDLVNTESYRAAAEKLTRGSSETKLFADTYREVITPKYIGDQQQKNLEEAVREWAKEQVSKTPVQNYYDYAQYSFEKDANGNLWSYIDVATGSDGKQLFANKEAAEKFINSSPFLKGEAEALQEVNGWKVRVKLNVPEQGVILGYSGWEKDKDWKLNRGVRFFRRTLGIPREAAGQDYALITGKDTAKTKLWRNFNDTAKKLSKDEMNSVESVYRQSIYEAAEDPDWKRYSDEILKDRFNLNETQRDLLREYYKVSDAAALEKDLQLNHSLTRKGMRALYIDGEEGFKIGKRAEKMNKEVFSRNSFIDVSKIDEEGNGVYKFGELTEETWKDLEDKGYVAVKLWKPEVIMLNNKRVPITYYIGPREKITSKELPQGLIGFHPEGSRGYDESSVFLKQPNIYDNDGVTLVGTSYTKAADVDYKKVQTQAKELNEVLPIYRKYKEGSLDSTSASIQINEATAGNKYVRFASVDDLEKNIGKGKLIEDYRYNFEAVRSNEELQQVAEIKARGGIPLTDSEDYDDILYDLSAKDKRGKGLLMTFENEYTPIAGFSDMMERNINSIAYNRFQRPYIEYMGRSLRQQFGDLIKPQYLNLSDDELLRNGEIFKDIPAGSPNVQRVSAAKNLQSDYKLRTNVKTDYDRFFENVGVQLAEKLGLDKDSIIGKTVKDLEPNKLLKSWNWLNTMGWWNVRQAIVQAAGAYNVALISPVQAPRIMSRYMPLRAAIAAKTEKQIEASVEAVSRFNLINKKEATGLVDYLRRVDAGNTEGRLSSYEAIKALEGISNSSTMFFREGEKFNAVSAHGAAYLEYIAKHPEAAGRALTNDEMVDVATTANYYYLTMGRNASSEFEKFPLTSALAQFSSFAQSSIEALIGKQLTAGQKTRLLVGNLLGFGTAGTIGTPMYTYYSWLQDQGVSPEVTETMRTGGFNALIRAAGGNIDISDLGMGILTTGILGKSKDAWDSRGVVDLVRAIPSVNGMRVLADLPGTIKDGMTTIINWVDPHATDEKVIGDLKALYTRNIPSSLGNYIAAYLMYKTGNMYDKKGRLTQEDPTAWDIWGKIFGFTRDTNAVYEYVTEVLKDETKLYDDIAESLRREYIKAHEENEYGRYLQLKEILLHPLTSYQQEEAEVRITDMERSIEDLDTTIYNYWDRTRDRLPWNLQDKIERQLEVQGVKPTW